MDTSETPVIKTPDVRRVQALLSEFLGTMFLLLTIQTIRTGQIASGFVGVGLTVGGMIYAFDHVSGAHFNPAVTLGVVLNGKMRVGTALLYVISQVLGGLVGALLSIAITSPTSVPPLLPSSSAPFGSLGSAVAVEFIFTCALVLVQQNAGAAGVAQGIHSACCAPLKAGSLSGP
jgi:aquaporin Z